MKRARGIFWLLVVLSLLSSGAFAAEVLTNDSILTMVKTGLGEEVIIGKIRISQGQYALATNDILTLKSDGVSDKIIQAMIEASAPPTPTQPKTEEAVAQETQDAITLYRQGKTVEAVAAFDKLIAERPGDDELKIWKALALLEQARAMKDGNRAGFKPLVVSAYGILHSLGKRHVMNPDWNFAMAKAFWLNDRPTWAKRAAGKALDLRANFAEPYLLLGDLVYDDEVSARALSPVDPRRENAMRFPGSATRKEYEKALALPDLRSELRAEGLYKLGMVTSEFGNKKDTARDYWERAMAADPACRYGIMAQEKLKAVAGK
jgi:tetratricopeptide (TPR) repeat protein